MNPQLNGALGGASIMLLLISIVGGMLGHWLAVQLIGSAVVFILLAFSVKSGRDVRKARR